MRKGFLVIVTLLIAPAVQGTTLTFSEALVLAGERRGAPRRDFAGEISAARRFPLPSVRAEVTTNLSRTLDLFAEGPLESRYAMSVIAFDYSLWDGGSGRSRLDLLETRLQREASGLSLNDARFTELLEAFGDLYVAQQQTEILRPLFEELSGQAGRQAQLVASGEITNIAATEYREIALAFASRLLELEARRIASAAKLRRLTGITEEPTIQISLDETSAECPDDPNQPCPPLSAVRDDQVEALDRAIEQTRFRLGEAGSRNAFRIIMSGYGGFGAAQSTFRGIESDGAFGVYGLRFTLSYPLFGGVSSIPLIEAGSDLERIQILREEALEAARARAEDYQLRARTALKRMALLRESVQLARAREQSLQRLVNAGMRTATELGQAQSERTRRETDLLAAEVERWKALQLLRRMLAAGSLER